MNFDCLLFIFCSSPFESNCTPLSSLSLFNSYPALILTQSILGGEVFDDVETLKAQNANGIFTLLFDIPNEMVGRIIGREGATVRIIQKLSSCVLDIPPEAEPGSTHRRVKIIGTPCHILYCKAIIESKISNGEESSIPLPEGDQVRGWRWIY